MTLTLLRLLVLVLSGLTALTARAQQPIDTLHIAILGDSNTWLGGDECLQPSLAPCLLPQLRTQRSHMDTHHRHHRQCGGIYGGHYAV